MQMYLSIICMHRLIRVLPVDEKQVQLAWFGKTRKHCRNGDALEWHKTGYGALIAQNC